MLEQYLDDMLCVLSGSTSHGGGDVPDFSRPCPAKRYVVVTGTYLHIDLKLRNIYSFIYVANIKSLL